MNAMRYDAASSAGCTIPRDDVARGNLQVILLSPPFSLTPLVPSLIQDSANLNDRIPVLSLFPIKDPMNNGGTRKKIGMQTTKRDDRYYERSMNKNLLSFGKKTLRKYII